MKKLSIEQKAKRYDEALERMKAWVKGEYPEYFTEAQKAAEFIFPELKESEDDRIRKAILGLVMQSSEILGNQNQSNMITWLEKQGSYTKKDVDEAYLKGISDAKNEIEKQYEANYQIRKDIATFIFNYRGNLKDRAKWMNYLGIKVSFVKNQDEQNPQPSLTPKSALEAAKEKKVDNQNCVNPTDKVKLQFKLGDWIVNNVTKDVFLMKEFNSGYYKLEDVNGNIYFPCLPPIDDDNHHWTIQDAKEGDVLVYKGDIKYLNGVKYERICLFKNLDNAFFTLTTTSNYIEEYDIDVNIDYLDNTVPATKEQRDLLFQKIEEAGYEWDTDKKELKKIDDEEVNGEDYGIDGLWHAQRILEKTLGNVNGYQTDDGILDHKAAITAVKKLYEQKPTWSEEDEKRLNSCLIILQPKTLVGNTETMNTKWLKSLKERIGG